MGVLAGVFVPDLRCQFHRNQLRSSEFTPDRDSQSRRKIAFVSEGTESRVSSLTIGPEVCATLGIDQEAKLACKELPADRTGNTQPNTYHCAECPQPTGADSQDRRCQEATNLDLMFAWGETGPAQRTLGLRRPRRNRNLGSHGGVRCGPRCP
jgi:hypothetical protein